MEIDLADNESAPWHNAALSMASACRMAAGKPLAMRLMAAMAQDDCRKCGYDCAGYANALVLGEEKRWTLCETGGKETSRLLQAARRRNRDEPGRAANAGSRSPVPSPHSPRHRWRHPVAEGDLADRVRRQRQAGARPRVHAIGLWDLLLRGDDMSTLVQKFIWDAPLKYKLKFIEAIDKHLSDRYPMFKGLSKGWPTANHIVPYVRPAEERKKISTW